MTIPYAEVIGDPIAHSKSPLIHGFWLDRLGLAGSYSKTHVLAADLPDFLARRRADPDWRGCNVTLPHKQAVIALLDRLDPLAARIGAVNTIVPEDGALVGYNTDAAGFLEPLAGPLAERHLLRTARIFGTGGAARAIAHGLAGQGFAIILIGRDTAAASALAAELDTETHVAPLDHFAEALEFDWGESGDRLDLVVNATSLGMTGKPPLPVHLSHLPPGAIVYDAVYAPLETPLLAEARAAGHPVVDGLAMLIGQARLAFRHFFGTEAPADAGADDALRLILTR
ncbi:shikimate dehydrogenase [Sphingomonas quercus]|uniref:Shikimate dehydrogenase (NADP(+)) n=1 Tax=Sphingomonas quercus TaxID=2842451 RepID=A0ABS6BF39_9SPHN|nr:shikimate dehydrogenase [Sphingomonas quercus]MBU3076923.1 shikimate dehydrogenase [Sphingomonas quercus]